VSYETSEILKLPNCVSEASPILNSGVVVLLIPESPISPSV